MSINDQWVRYLAAEGYVGNVNDMLQQALQSETGSNLKQVNTLWVEYLRGEGYSGSLNDMMYQWLGDKGYTGSLNDRWMQALINDDVFGGVVPPIGCVITLTGDIAAAFGGQPLDISGQVVSKTVPAAPSNTYIAGGASNISGWSGWRAVGYRASEFTTSGDSEHTFFVFNTAYTAYVGLLYNNAGSGGWLVLVNGTPQSIIAGNSDDKVAIRIDGSSGDVEVHVNSEIKTKADIPQLGGLFSGAEVFPAAILGGLVSPTLTEGDTYAAQIYTAAADLADVGFPAGTLDWCGDAI